MALWLMAHRNERYWWSSTKQTAMVIDGLAEYVKRTGELIPDFDGSIVVNSRAAISKHFTQKDALAALPEHAIVANAHSGSPAIEVKTNGTGRLYSSGSDDFYSSDRNLVDKGPVKLNIVREYFRLRQSTKDRRIIMTLSR